MERKTGRSRRGIMGVMVLAAVCAAAALGFLWGSAGKDAAAPPPAGSPPAATPVPAPEPTPSPTPEPPSLEEQAQAILEEMTLEEKVGQMFLARRPETDTAQKAAAYHLGGYLLFGRDIRDKTREELVQAIQSDQDAVEIPLFIGVDEEGGTVNRVSSNPNLRATPFRSPQELYAEGGFERVRSDAQEKCRLLKSLGFQLNFAPVCDVSQDPEDFIYDRSFGQGAEQTAQYVGTVVGAMEEEGMGSVLKHFPGYGNNADTHTGLAYDQRPYETFLESDFLPFRAGIEVWTASGPPLSRRRSTAFSGRSWGFPGSSSPTTWRWTACGTLPETRRRRCWPSRRGTTCSAARILRRRFPPCWRRWSGGRSRRSASTRRCAGFWS